VTTGGSLLACRDPLEGEGVKVLGAIGMRQDRLRCRREGVRRFADVRAHRGTDGLGGM